MDNDVLKLTQLKMEKFQVTQNKDCEKLEQSRNEGKRKVPTLGQFLLNLPLVDDFKLCILFPLSSFILPSSPALYQRSWKVQLQGYLDATI